MKNFSYRSYSSKLYRPQPIINSNLENSIITIATPWGSKAAAEKSSELINDFYLSTRGDQEATSPFERLTCLSQEANNLRIAVLFANEKIYNDENYDEYTSSCELISLVQVGNEVHFIQIGQPALYLIRNGVAVLPMACHMDLSMNVSTEKNIISPLPSQLLGVEKHIDFSVRTFIPQSRDKVALLSRTFAPASFLNSPPDKSQLEHLTQNISQENPDNPFWLGLLEF